MIPIVVNKKSRVPYEYEGNNRFKNIHTGEAGEVPEDRAKDVFNISVEATAMFNEFPNIRELTQRLGLIIEPKE